jgi:hypothetical protein
MYTSVVAPIHNSLHRFTIPAHSLSSAKNWQGIQAFVEVLACYASIFTGLSQDAARSFKLLVLKKNWLGYPGNSISAFFVTYAHAGI